ncbi:MAG: hypothetical protein KGN76_12460 [Acidobacteriota bacterium]|nr:hypothetical protein [Acidobacteriota bacterium]
MPAFLSQLIANWAAVFGNYSALRTAVDFAHVGGLLAGGGCAVAADRATLIAARQEAQVRTQQLRALHGVHRVVLVALVFVVLSGVLLLASDLQTYIASDIFWLKMGLVALLLMNGGLLLRFERGAEQGLERAWRGLCYASIASLALWFLTTLAGVALTNI